MTAIEPAATGTTLDTLLPADLLARMDERAPAYDRDDAFFQEDFDELRATGFLDVALPAEFGGHGMRLDQVSEALGRIAYVAPATAPAVNTHVYCSPTSSSASCASASIPTTHSAGAERPDERLSRPQETHAKER